MKRNQKKIKTIKNKENKQKIYNVEIFLINNVHFIDINFNNEKNIKKWLFCSKKWLIEFLNQIQSQTLTFHFI